MSRYRKLRDHCALTRAAKVCAHDHAIVDHISRHLEPPAFALHELEEDTVHIDVHFVPPAANRAFWFVFTTGMSTLPMRTPPEEAPGSRFAEMSILLPPDWTIDRAAWERESRWFWPIRELHEAALLPHRHDSWLGPGHSIVNASADRLDPSTRLAAMVVLEPRSVPAASRFVTIGGRRIEFLTLWPVYPEELDYLLRHGSAELDAMFARAGIRDVIEPDRTSAIARRTWQANEPRSPTAYRAAPWPEPRRTAGRVLERRRGARLLDRVPLRGNASGTQLSESQCFTAS